MSPTNPVSPKIWAGANAAVIAGLVITLLGTLQPGSLDFLGKWAPLVYALVTVAVYSARAYLKQDSLRDAGVAALQSAADQAAAAAAAAAKQTSLAATALPTVNPAPAPVPVSFAATQDKLDASAIQLPAVFTPDADAPAAPAIPGPSA